VNVEKGISPVLLTMSVKRQVQKEVNINGRYKKGSCKKGPCKKGPCKKGCEEEISRGRKRENLGNTQIPCLRF
jgi:hypothetical protein